MHWLTPTATFAFKEAGREMRPGDLYAFDDTQAAALLSSGQMVNTPEGPRALGQVVRLRYADELEGLRSIATDAIRSNPWPRSLFVHRAGGFGDLLLLTPALRAFKRAHPHCKVTVCTMPRFREVLAGNPNVDAFAEFPPTNREIFAHDAVACFENIIENNPKARTTHAVDLYAERLGVEVDPADRRPDYLVTEEECAWAADFLLSLPNPVHLKNPVELRSAPSIGNRQSEIGNRPPRIGLQVKASTPVRSYPAGPLSDLVDLLTGEAQVLLFGAPGEVVTDGLNPRIVNLSALRVRFRQSCALLATCDALVAPDSALCHVAAALGVPTLALYGPFPSNLRLTSSCQDAHDAHGLCAPCFHHSRGNEIFPRDRPCARAMNCHILGSLPPARLFAAAMRLTREPNRCQTESGRNGPRSNSGLARY